jgi:hypothetical protein
VLYRIGFSKIFSYGSFLFSPHAMEKQICGNLISHYNAVSISITDCVEQWAGGRKSDYPVKLMMLWVGEPKSETRRQTFSLRPQTKIKWSTIDLYYLTWRNHRSEVNYNSLEKLLVAHVERLFVVEARIEPSTFRPVSPTFYQLSYSARRSILGAAGHIILTPVNQLLAMG